MVFQTFAPIGFLDIRLSTIPWNIENLVVILRLAPLQRGLSFLQLRS